MHRTTLPGPRKSVPLSNGTRIHPLAVGAFLVLIGLALCGYPRPVGPTPAAPTRQPPPLSLELNIPAFRLDVREESTLVRSYSVAVGMRRYKTPTGDFEIARVVWNPWWYPPDAEWAAKDTVTPPGPRNPMGKVKLLFNGPYYLHGTPLAASLGHAASHGCVRMRNEDAVELALLIQRHAGVELTAALADSLTSGWKKTRVFNLDSFVPVTIVYRTAEVRDSILTLYPDVYRRNTEGMYARAMSALFDAGFDTVSVNRCLVRRLTRRAAGTVVTLPIQQLFEVAVDGGLRP